MGEIRREVPDEINFDKDPSRKIPEEKTVSEREVLAFHEQKEKVKKVIVEFQLAKNAKSETEMIEHLREFYTTLMDILEPDEKDRFRKSKYYDSHILHDDSRDDMATLATLKWVVTGKKVPDSTDKYFILEREVRVLG